MRRSDLVQHKEKEKGATTRTSQIVFGERQHLLRVLDSLEGTELPIARMQQERRSLEEAARRDLALQQRRLVRKPGRGPG